METEIVNYIREAQKHGLTDLEIKQNLLDAGWDAATVENGLAYVRTVETRPQPNKDESIRANSLTEKTLPPQISSALQETATHAQLAITEQHFKQSGNAGFWKRPIFWIALVVLAILGAGGYFAYAYVYNNPAKVWSNFISAGKSNVYETGFKFSYADNTESTDATSSLPNSLALEGTGYTDVSDQNNPQSSADFTLSYSGNGTSVSKNFKYRFFNNNFFLYFGQLPADYTTLFNGKNYEWLKLDISSLNDMIQQAESKSPSASGTVTSLTDYKKQLQARLVPIWQQANLVKMDKYLGKDKVGNINTYHFQNSLDKQALVKAANDSLNAIIDVTESLPDFTGDKVTENDKAAMSAAIQALIDKAQIKEFETWIGTKDFRLYKVHFVSNALSLNALANNSETLNNVPIFNSARAKSRDAKRLADLKQISTALELYYNDYSGYPEADQGKPVAISPAYLGVFPETPVPADGACSNWYNTYWYQPTGKAFKAKGVTLYPSYEVSSCFGGAVGGYSAGITKLTPQGIQSGLPCTESADKCAPGSRQELQSAAEQVKQQIDKLNFDAEIKLDLTYSNYGQTKILEAPAEYFDILKELQNLLPSALGLNKNPGSLAGSLLK